jgi:predicted ATPase/DNA-binding SARP family transcriptional activator/class 3 adenylate cyclase
VELAGALHGWEAAGAWYLRVGAWPLFKGWAARPGEQAMTAVGFAVLGPVEVTAGGQPVGVGGPRTRAVLARLALAANHVVAAEAIAGELWPDLGPGRAAANLQVRVAELRRAFGRAGAADRLVTRPPGYLLVASPEEVDAAWFGQLAARGRALLGAGDAAGAAACLAEALGLWRGPPLADVGDLAWARAEAARLGEARLAAVECHAQARLECGQASELIAELEALTGEHRLRERLWGLRMLALYRCGRQAEALGAYQQLRTILVEELGIEPSAELRQLHQQILAQDPALALVPPAPAGGPARGRLPDAEAPAATGGAPAARAAAPVATFTFLVTDIEGSTGLLERLGESVYAQVLAGHRALIRAGLAAHDGREIDTPGDAFFAVFSSPRGCVAAVLEMQQALAAHAWPGGEQVRVRMGITTGEASQTDAGLVGLDVHRAARVAAAGYGGQVLLSEAAAALVRDSLPPGVSLADLGVHRLKDLGRPERIFQLQAAGLQDGFPPLRSLGNPALPNNLPAQLSAFVGRARELSEVCALVESSRLVTLTGAGGCGKTRLGLQAAAGLLDGSGDGVWLVELAAVTDPEAVAPAICQALGIAAQPGRSARDALTDTLAPQNVLIVLDNCEHLIGGCAKTAEAIVTRCPRVHLLATSREPLGIGGETIYQVPSLSLPEPGDWDPAAAESADAVALFLERARAQGTSLPAGEATVSLVVSICARLDGLPLAIELAAARLRSLSLGSLHDRLDQRFRLLTGGSRTALPRQQTLRATVEWSWELLNGAEQALLGRLPVFAGGFDLDAAEAVCGFGDIDQFDVAGLLGALVDKSLVTAEPAGPTLRYRLLETIRQYAAGQLDALGPAAAGTVRAAHRDYYLELAEAAAPQLVAAEQAVWLDRLDAELGNLRAAISFSVTQADPGPGLRLAAALREYWLARGDAAEGAGALRAFLDAPAAQEATLLRARALRAAAGLLQATGAYPVAGDYCAEALAIARAAGDENLVAEALYQQTQLLLRQGQLAAALPVIETGLALTRRLGELRLAAELLIARTYATYIEGDPADAVRDAAEAVRLFRQAGDQLRVEVTLGNLGNMELAAGDLDAARRHLAEALDIARALNTRGGIAHQTVNLGLAEYLDGSPGTAGTLFAESFDLARRTGIAPLMPYTMIGLALAGHDGAGPGWSARLHGAADQALADLGHALEPLEARLADLDRQRLRAAIGTEAFDAEYAAGRALTPQQIVDLAHGKRA